jgi:hypothetical protein
VATNSNLINLPSLESEILRSVREISWANQLWFPIVQRHMLKLHSDAHDEDIHAAVISLIEKRALVPISPYLPFSWEMANPDKTPGTDPITPQDFHVSRIGSSFRRSYFEACLGRRAVLA